MDAATYLPWMKLSTSNLTNESQGFFSNCSCTPLPWVPPGPEARSRGTNWDAAYVEGLTSLSICVKNLLCPRGMLKVYKECATGTELTVHLGTKYIRNSSGASVWRTSQSLCTGTVTNTVQKQAYPEGPLDRPSPAFVNWKTSVNPAQWGHSPLWDSSQCSDSC